MTERKTIAFLTGAAADWGGASRVVFTTLELLDRSRFEPLVLLPEAGPIIERLQARRTRYVIWGDAREPRGPFHHARDVVDCMRRLRAFGIDLLDVNFRFWRAAEVLAAWFLRIPVVTHYHLVTTRWGPYMRLSSAIVPVSRFTAERSGPPGVPKVVVPNSVMVDRFDRGRDIRSAVGLEPGHVVFTFVGQVREVKGVDLFIRMARAMRGESLRFLIVGECRDPERFPDAYTEERLCAEIGDDPRIRYLGYRTDVENVFVSSDVIVAPSRWGEPLGLVNLEAGAARRPVLAARDGGVPEIVSHGENGFLVEPGDVEALVRHAELLSGDAALRAEMGARGRRLVEERFVATPVRKLERLYDALLAGGRVTDVNEAISTAAGV